MKRCVVCGESDEKVLEWHHFYGRKYGEQAGWLCLNHHKIVTLNQNQIPTKIRKSNRRIDKDIFALSTTGSLVAELGTELVMISKRLCDRHD